MSMPAKVLGYGFAFIAAAVSAAFAVTLSDNQKIQALLVLISVGAVIYERCSLPWTQQNFRANNNSAARIGLVLLAAACLYTASMQLGFFGSIMLAPISADAGTRSSIADADAKVNELEVKRRDLPKPPGDSSSFSKLVANLEVIKNKSTQDRVDLSNARNNLAAASALEKIEADIETARKERTDLITKPPKDAKGAVIERLSFGYVPGEWLSYGAVVLSVALLQLMQICLPVVSGEGHKPTPLAEGPPTAAPALPALTAASPAPAPALMQASNAPKPANDTFTSPPPAPVAHEVRPARKNAGRARIAQPAPARRGLAAKLRVVG